MAYSATGGLMSTASAATAIAADPNLPVIVDLVLQLQSIEKDKASSGSAGAASSGVGLRNVVGPLRMFVAVQKRPWIVPVVTIGVLGAVFAGGYLVSERRRKRK
jgi:hypothetical protein